MRLALIVVVCVLAVGVVWLAGEQHKRNCISTGKTCSALPWDAGTTPQSAATPTATTATLTAQGCLELALDNAQATTTDQIKPVPPECQGG
jgi:hypothetical protein